MDGLGVSFVSPATHESQLKAQESMALDEWCGALCVCPREEIDRSPLPALYYTQRYTRTVRCKEAHIFELYVQVHVHSMFASW